MWSTTLYWSEELGKFLFVWISLAGISLGEEEAYQDHDAHRETPV